MPQDLSGQIKTAPLQYVFNFCAPARRGRLEAQLLAAAAAPRGSKEAAEAWPKIEKLLKAGAALEAVNKTGSTALNLLCENGNSSLALALLRAGASPYPANAQGMTPFLSAVYAGAPEIARALLAKGADPRAIDANDRDAIDVLLGHIPLGQEKEPAYREQRCETLKLLLEAGLTLNTGQENRIYRVVNYLLPAVPALQAIHSLSKAAVEGDFPAAQRLLAQGLHPDAPAAYGDHGVLTSAAQRGDLALLEVALEAGANVDLRSGPGKITALQRAVLSGQKECFTRLLATRADPALPYGPYERMPLIRIAKDTRIPGLSQFVGLSLFELEPNPMVLKKDITVRVLRLKSRR